MSYKEWFEVHTLKHAQIVSKLQAKNFSNEQIREYFDFENMLKNEKDFCPLYAKGKKCHDMEKLNCYFCACPHFRFNDDGIEQVDSKTLYSTCSINSKDGSLYTYGDAIHQDCSKCTIPHHPSFVKNNTF
ncbi:hypothetical protein [Sulfurimonas sp.]|uniref:hypothetical protein n=1 Tax=Sulfurimonas sp. TaxID=2022749 RepID=UPI003D097445